MFVELVESLSQPPQVVSEATTKALNVETLNKLAAGTPAFGLTLVNGIPKLPNELVN
jgi:hypothetical protein